jgi:hypothetical protein
MSGGTHTERIIDLLGRRPGIDDDEIARVLRIEPRQTVNQVCRRLAERGLVSRVRGDNGKIINNLTGGSPAPGTDRAPSLVPANFARTLLVVPCSKAKRDWSAIADSEDSIVRHLPTELAQELCEAPTRVKSKTPCDEAILVPAWQRYDGSLYRIGRQALADLWLKQCHIIILSGGYGAVLATEPIGMYNAALKPSWWPHHLLERVLIACAKRHGLVSVRAFASATSAYRRVLQRVLWRNEGIDDALLLTPDAEAGGTFKSPASLGEALCALSAGNLTTAWKSSYGLGLAIQGYLVWA